MADPFQQYGGREIPSPETPQNTDPFSKFGGTEVHPTTEVATPDPFAKFGGQAQPTPVPNEDPEYSKVRGIINRSFWSAPLVTSEETTDSELNAIARAHGVDPKVVRDMSGFAGALRGAKGNTWEEIQSSLGRGVGFNIPQFIAKKQLEDPNLRKAFDDIQDLADAKRSFARGTVENLVPTGLIAHAAEKGIAKGVTKAGLAKGLAEGAAVGGTYGLARSREGEEIPATLVGAGLGAGLAGAGHLVTRGLGSAEKALNQRAIENRQFQADVTAAGEKVAAETAGTEKVLARSTLQDVAL